MSLLSFYNKKNNFEAGCDEVGRGCLAGPVVAASVILPKRFKHKILTDSKLLLPEERALLVDEIKKKAVAWSIGWCSPAEIDEINILNASFLAMHRAVDQLKQIPDFLLIDGNRFNPYKEIPHECIIQGDSKYFSIAAASVLAKEYRDSLMKDLAKSHPHYGWETNVGYSTLAHRRGIEKFGTCEQHRKSFRMLPQGFEDIVDEITEE